MRPLTLASAPASIVRAWPLAIVLRMSNYSRVNLEEIEPSRGDGEIVEADWPDA